MSCNFHQSLPPAFFASSVPRWRRTRCRAARGWWPASWRRTRQPSSRSGDCRHCPKGWPGRKSSSSPPRPPPLAVESFINKTKHWAAPAWAHPELLQAKVVWLFTWFCNTLRIFISCTEAPFKLLDDVSERRYARQLNTFDPVKLSLNIFHRCPWPELGIDLSGWSVFSFNPQVKCLWVGQWKWCQINHPSNYWVFAFLLSTLLLL